MPVLETIRKGTDSTAMRLVFGAIVLVFVFWGIGKTGGPKSQTIAEVNGVRITDTQFQRIMRQQSRSMGGSQDEAETKALAKQVIASLIDRTVMLQEADRLGVFVSDEEIARQVLAIDAFRDSEGVFEPKLYERNLKRMGLTRGKFEEQLRDEMKLDKLNEIAQASVVITEAEVRERYERIASQLTLSFIDIPDQVMLSQVPVDDAAIDAFIASSPEQLRSAYEADLDARYKVPAKASMSMILLRTDLNQGQIEDAEVRQRLEKVLEQAKAGTPFDELARRYSEDLSAVNGGDIGELARPQMDPDIAKAVFAVEPGQVTDVVEVARGYEIVQVHTAQAEQITPFEDVQRDIARELIAQQGVGEVADKLANELLTQWKTDGAPPAERIAELGLQVRTVPGLSPARLDSLAALGSPTLQEALSKTTTVGVLERPYLTAGGRVVAAIADYQPADMALFEQTKTTLLEQVRAGERSGFLQAWHQDLVSRAHVEQYYHP